MVAAVRSFYFEVRMCGTLACTGQRIIRLGCSFRCFDRVVVNVMAMGACSSRRPRHAGKVDPVVDPRLQ